MVQRVPDASRHEIAQDVTGMIAEMMEARMGESADQGTVTEEQAERLVLEELGDPFQLSQRYTDVPQHLIGPGLYRGYIRTLQWFLPLVGILVLLVTGIVTALTEPGTHSGAIVGTAVVQTVIVLLISFAVITIGMALFERVASGDQLRELADTTYGAWSVDQLDTRPKNSSPVRAEAILALIMVGMLAVIPLLQTTWFYIGHLNDGEMLINPALPFEWVLGYWALLVLLAATEVWKIVDQHLRKATVMISGIVDILLAIYLTIALFTQEILHPDLTVTVTFDRGVWIAISGIWVITVWDQISTVRSYRLQRVALSA